MKIVNHLGRLILLLHNFCIAIKNNIDLILDFMSGIIRINDIIRFLNFVFK